MRPYSREYYKNQEGGSKASARIVLPIVFDLIQPKSVVDIGCGVGTWLSVCSDLGATSIYGYDGSWIQPENLHIPTDSFETIDLENIRPIERTADMAICLEVGEHLSPSATRALIQTLTLLAPVILFSAAIPYQGGTNHINEQWPQYWAVLFKQEGYVPVDCIRRRVWNSNIEYWYAQNSLIYVKRERIADYPKLAAETEQGFPAPLPLVHPTKFLYVAERYRLIEPFFSFLPWSVIRAGKRLLTKIIR